MFNHLSFVQNSYSWEATFALAIVSFLIGFFFKSGIIYKQRKRILKLEDEMLSNHSHILSLEKKIAETKTDKTIPHPEFEIISNLNKERETKVS